MKILLFLLLALPFFSGAQSKADKAAALKSLVESGNYVFKAQSAMPMSGRVRQLTDDYTLKITKEKVACDLPYFGRAYTAPMDPSQGGIRFSSAVFDYTITPGKKDGWQVLIKPTDYRDVQQLALSITSSGYATLQVISTSRQQISFNGIIAAPRKP
jgi:Domain of unknown function (DUF4251)